MKKILLFTILTFSVICCVKFPYNNKGKENSEIEISPNFDWKTFHPVTVSSEGVFSVINQVGDTIATNLPAGEYKLYVGNGSILTVVPSSTNPESKAISAPSTGTKSRIYFPSQNNYATLMFEDLFPYPGDKDMNDLVCGLNIEYDLNNKAQVLAINFNIQPRATGSTKTNIGFAANFSGKVVAVSKITRSSSVYPAIRNDHSDLSPTYLVDLKNGYYNPVRPSDALNADYRVAPFTGNMRFFFDSSPPLFINVYNHSANVSTIEFTAQVVLNSTALAYSTFTFLEGYDATKINISLFATFDGRGNEVHFKNQLPTKYFDQSHFNIANSNFTYGSNWVWAIMSDKSIRHPVENVAIYNTYPNFITWVQQQNITNWYSNINLQNAYTNGIFPYFN